MVAKPRKFLDDDQSEINPEWRAWHIERIFEDADHTEVGMYFPEEFDKAIPEKGAWIRVIDVPRTDLDARFTVPLLSMWRARRHEVSGIGSRYGLRPQQAVIRTPGGDLHLWAHEYTLVPDITEWVGQEPDVVMHSLGGEPVLDEERAWYMSSRGIPRDQVALMLLNEVTSQDVVWFEMDPYYVEVFGGVGTSLTSHIARHPRSA